MILASQNTEQHGVLAKTPSDRLSESPSVNRIVLVTPPSAFLLDERVFLSLGLLKVAAVLESRGVCVEHLDLSGIENF